MSDWGLVARTDELSRLVAAATGASGTGLILSGAAGSGKSRLLAEAVAGLDAEHYAVHSAAAAAGRAALPFGALSQVLPTAPPARLSTAGLTRWAVDLLGADAGHRPIVLAVDDAHLLDPSSAALVHLLVREGARLLGTLRTGEPVPAAISSLWTEGLLEHAELAPLTQREARDLLTALLGGPVETASAARLARLAGGNPLLLRELVAAAQGGGELVRTYGIWRWTGRLTLADSLADLVGSRIGRLRGGLRDVVELVAFGEPVGLALLLRLAGAADVEAAEERGLVRVVEDGRRREVRLVHQLDGEVVRRRCPVTRARRQLAALADGVERTGVRRHHDRLRITVWRLDAGIAQEPGVLLEAAHRAYARYDLELAQRLAEAAGAAGAGYPAAELLSTVLLFADQPDRAAAVLDEAAAAPPTGTAGPHPGPAPAGAGAGVPARAGADVPAPAEAGVPADRLATARAGVAFWGHGRAGAADRLAEAAARATGPARRARMRAVEAVMRLQLTDLTTAAGLAGDVLADDAAEPGDRELARCVQAALAAAGGDPAGSAHLLGPVPAVRRWDPAALQYALPPALGARLTVALDLSGIDELLAGEFAGLAQAGGFGFGAGWAALLRAQGAWLRGRTGEALEAAEQACAALAANRLHDGNAHAARAHAAALRGDTALAAAAIEVADRAEEHTDRLSYPGREQARAWTAACAGDVAGGVRRLEDLVSRLRADGLAGYEVLALHDLVRLGHAGPAAERMRALLAGAPGRPAANLLLRHAEAAATGDAGRLFAVARDLATCGYLVFAAEAAALAVRSFRAARDSRALAASTLLADLLARCDTVRTPALSAVQPSLTSRERQVAELAAGGVRSKEIAGQLFLSPRTVENHLQRVYAKLGVTGRMELAPALRTLPQ